MSEDLKILSMASAMARHAARRHQVLAENIANADTAGYRAKDLEPFAQAYGRSLSSLSTTGAENRAEADSEGWRVLVSGSPDSQSPNGNSVSLDDQMMRSADAQQAHEAATAIYKKTIDILRISLGRGV